MARRTAQSLARFAGKKARPTGNNKMGPHDQAIVENRTRFPKSVKNIQNQSKIFKSGHNNAKIGRYIEKGKLQDFEIYTLTLEERATCPRYCKQFRACYGNNMHLAHRWKHGRELEWNIAREIAGLSETHPDGFMVRLHILGDFYSEAYVKLWRYLMTEHKNLYVFGFTARIDESCEITKALVAMLKQFPERWHMRFSGATDYLDEMASEVVDLPEFADENSIVCPQQTEKTLTCGTCGLCWESKNNIAFIEH